MEILLQIGAGVAFIILLINHIALVKVVKDQERTVDAAMSALTSLQVSYDQTASNLMTFMDATNDAIGVLNADIEALEAEQTIEILKIGKNKKKVVKKPAKKKK